MTRKTVDERLRFGGNSSFKGAIRQERTMRSIRRNREMPRRGISIDKGRIIKLVLFGVTVFFFEQEINADGVVRIRA